MQIMIYEKKEEIEKVTRKSLDTAVVHKVLETYAGLF